MKKISYLLLAFGLGILLAFENFAIVNASKHYVSTPASLRGTWYQYDQQSSYFIKMKITKYNWFVKYAPNKSTLVSGKKFIPGTNINRLVVQKFGHKGYWKLEENHTDYRIILKRGETNINGHKYAALKEYNPYAPYGISIWTHYKK